MLEQMGIAARQASYTLAQLSCREKNRVLETIADHLESQSEEILVANAEDLAQARENGLSEAMLDRLALTPARLTAIANDVRQVCVLADPVGQVIDGGLLDSGLRIERRRVPLGSLDDAWRQPGLYPATAVLLEKIRIRLERDDPTLEPIRRPWDW